MRPASIAALRRVPPLGLVSRLDHSDNSQTESCGGR